MVHVSNVIYKLIVHWSRRPSPNNPIICHDRSTTAYPKNCSHLQIWENSSSLLMWSLFNDTAILSPKIFIGMNYLAFFWPFSKTVLFCYGDRDHHQDEISELCPKTILIDLVSEALFQRVAHILWGQTTPIPVSSRLNHKIFSFTIPCWAQNTLPKPKSFITQICDPQP